MFQAGEGLATRFVRALVRTGDGALWVCGLVGGDEGHIGLRVEGNEGNERGEEASKRSAS